MSKTTKTTQAPGTATLVMTFTNGDPIYREHDGTFFDSNGKISSSHIQELMNDRKEQKLPYILPKVQKKPQKKDKTPKEKKKGKQTAEDKSECWVKANRDRSYCFTLNNYTVDGIKKLLDNANPDYFVVGFEIAPNTGTPHLQGYLYIKNKIAWASLNKKLNGDHAKYNKIVKPKNLEDDSDEEYEESHADYYWLKNAKQDFQANFCYCTKELDWLESNANHRPQQGKRNDIIMMQREIDSGVPLPDVVKNHASRFLTNMSRSIKAYLALNPPYVDNKQMYTYKPKHLHALIQTLCDDMYQKRHIYICRSREKLEWPGYWGQKVVIIFPMSNMFGINENEVPLLEAYINDVEYQVNDMCLSAQLVFIPSSKKWNHIKSIYAMEVNNDTLREIDPNIELSDSEDIPDVKDIPDIEDTDEKPVEKPKTKPEVKPVAKPNIALEQESEDESSDEPRGFIIDGLCD
jgi:hypothetical protein